MDVQTQVTDEATPSLSLAEVNDQSSLADFKEALTNIRLQRITLAQQVDGLSKELNDLVSARTGVLQMFESEAVAMYPELQGKNIEAVLYSVSTDHPLSDLWGQYKQKIEQIVIIMQDKLGALAEMNADAVDLSNQEAVVLNAYSVFASSAVTAVPTPEQLLAELQAVEVIPYVEEGSVRANMNAIEMLSPSAASLVTLQALEVEREGDYSESYAQTPTQETSQLNTMTAAQDLTEGAGVNALLSPKGNAELKKMGTWFAVAAVAYLIFGGKKA